MIRGKTTPELIEEVCRGQIFLGCVIKDSSMVYLLARKNVTIDDASSLRDHEIPSRVIAVAKGDGEMLRMGGININNFNLPVIGISAFPRSQVLVVSNDNDGTVLPLGGGKQTWPYESLHKGAIPGCKRIRCIDNYSWAVCNRRLVYKRTDVDQWENIRNGFDPEMSPYGDLDTPDCGFKDIDGFSEQEIYAVGGKSNIWRYDGTRWFKCRFPKNEYLSTVCCAKDGYVYIGTRNALWKGKESSWQKVCDLKVSREINDLRWFDNKLWLSYDYSLHMWDGTQLVEEIIYDGKKLPLSGFIDTSDDMLLVAGSYAAWTYDGKDWFNIIPDFN